MLAVDPLVPRSIVQMIHAGERSGQLGEVMGTIVDSIVISLLLPIFSISRIIAH